MSTRAVLRSLLGAGFDASFAALSTSHATVWTSDTVAMRALVTAHSFAAMRAQFEEKRSLGLALAPASGGYARLTMEGAAATTIFDDLHEGGALLMAPPDHAEIADVGRALGEELALCVPSDVRAELILTRKGHFTRIHVDDPPGLNIQLAGSKRWAVSAKRATAAPRASEMAYIGHPEGGVRDAEEALDLAFTMRPGDCLFIPAGCQHQVSGLDDSVSLLISFHDSNHRWLDAFVHLARREMLRDPAARAPRWLDKASDAARARSVLSAFEARITSLCAEDVLAALVEASSWPG